MADPLPGVEPPFQTLEAAMAWLDGAAIVEGNSHTASGIELR